MALVPAARGGVAAQLVLEWWGWSTEVGDFPLVVTWHGLYNGDGTGLAGRA